MGTPSRAYGSRMTATPHLPMHCTWYVINFTVLGRLVQRCLTRERLKKRGTFRVGFEHEASKCPTYAARLRACMLRHRWNQFVMYGTN